MPAYKRDKDDKDDVWRYRKWVTLPSGERVRIYGTPAINTKKAAEDAEKAHVERVLNPPAPQRERLRMTDVLERFLTDYVMVANNKPSEVAGKRSAVDRYLKPELGDLYIDQVDEPKILELSAKLHTMEKTRGEGTLSAKYVKNLLQTLRKCLRWSKKMKWISEVPEIQMPRVDEEEIRFLEGDEADALLAAMTDEPVWFAAAVLALDAGLRKGELRALKWTDYNRVTDKLTLARSRWRAIDGSTKSRKPRTIRLTKRLAAALHAIRTTALRGAYVLSRANGAPLTDEGMQDAIERLTRTAKLSDCGWHTLRHTFITRLAMRGVPPRTIQDLAGHASIATTMRYMHVVKGATDDAIALLDSEGESRVKDSSGSEISPEAGEIIRLPVVTPLGLEPKFSP